MPDDKWREIEAACKRAVDQHLGTVTLDDGGLHFLRGLCEKAAAETVPDPDAYEIYLAPDPDNPTCLHLGVHRKTEQRG